MSRHEKLGVLLINTGTTDAPEEKETRTYLRQFLSDPRVLDINPVVRWLLLNLVILRKRPKESAHAYSKVWTQEGSPLVVETKALRRSLEHAMPEAVFSIGMRYGNPSIRDGLVELINRSVDRILVAPLFPQYASAATGSAVEEVYRVAGSLWNVPTMSTLAPFYEDPGFLDAWVAVAKGPLEAFQPDHVLFSYHGLPERHVLKSDPTGKHCLKSQGCCDRIVDANKFCYRAHCFATTRGLVHRFRLLEGEYTQSFQSRLGRDPWLKPPTDEVVPNLAKMGVRRLAVLCPAFTADCLETLEEIGIRARESFIDAGGEDFLFVPCLNDHPMWVEALVALLKAS